VERDYKLGMRTEGNLIPSVDARLPIADALLACMAARHTLTASSIEELAERLAGTPQSELVWTMGLECSQALMGNDRALDIKVNRFWNSPAKSVIIIE